MARPKKTIKEVVENVVENVTKVISKKEEAPKAPVVPTFDPSIPENKQRHLR